MHAAPWIGYHARRTPERAAVQDLGTGRSWTFAQLDDRIDRLAAHLHGAGMQAGDRVGVLSQNSTNVFEVLYACAALGATMVPLNWRLSPRELAAIVADSTPAALLWDASQAAVAAPLAEEAGIGVRLRWAGAGGGGTAGVGERDDDPYETALAAADPADRPPADFGPDQPWTIIYTSGTTGLPKGAVHTVGSVRANIENSALAGEVGSTSCCLTVLPTFHVAGLHLFANAALYHGGSVLVMHTFDPDTALELLWDPDLGVTHFCGVPANFQFMSQTERFRTGTPRPFTSVVGGSPVPGSVVEQWSAKGAVVMPVFGITEAGSTVIMVPPGARTEPGCVGLPVVNAECEVRDRAGVPVGPDEIGELWVRGPMVMRGYWNRDQATAEAVVDGWLRTGDAARIDGRGFVHIVDRWKDMYITGGENVYPAETENVLYQHPDVVLASVVGVADPKWGEVGLAFVVLKDQARVTEEELAAWCRERLARYKVPASFRFVGDLPRNATGKILKNELRDQAR